MKNETIIFDPITPHAAPVNIAALLTDIEAVIKRHVILSDHAATALAVWVLHTYTFELRDTVAYVAIESPEKRCGKTTLLSVLAAMACKPLIASNVTLSALFRAIDTCSPTLFIDEADTFLAGNGAMRGIINSGNTRRAAYVLRLTGSKKVRQATKIVSLAPIGGEGRGEGANAASAHQPSTINHQLPESPDSGLKKYSCWCPKVIAMIGQVPDTIADRSIIVKMSRKLVTEPCAPLAELESSLFSLSACPSPAGAGEGGRRPGEGIRGKSEHCGESQGLPTEASAKVGEGARQGTIIGEIRSKCTRFALDAAPFIAQSPKFRADGLNDRAADTFDPLFIIARLAGEEWPEKLHTAAHALAASADSENSGSGLILDILDLFFDMGSEKLFTSDLVTLFREGGMKSHVLAPGAINEHQIAKVLRPYGIKPSTIRIGTHVQKGYFARDFREALHRYVPNAEIEARVEQTKLRMGLHAEAEKEKVLMKRAYDEAAKNGKVSFPEAMVIFKKLKAEAEASDETSEELVPEDSTVTRCT